MWQEAYQSYTETQERIQGLLQCQLHGLKIREEIISGWKDLWRQGSPQFGWIWTPFLN